MSRNALITGGSRGIGAAAARILSENGYNVIINYNNSENEAKALSKSTGCKSFKADLSVPSELDALLSFAGNVELLVNNAGISHYGLLTDTSLDAWQRVFDINTRAAFLCTKGVIPSMIRKKSGCIINISSMWGITGASCEAAYSASKAALIGFSKSMAKELGPSGIRVNCIAPGVIDTDMLKCFSGEERDELISETPLQRLGTVYDVAELILFLASEKSSFITGQVIGVDGGFVI